MFNVIEMPKLSTTQEKGKVVRWYKEEGEELEKGEILFEVETDKANVEVEAYVSGFLRKILVEAGVEVPVNTAIAVVADTRDEDISTALRGEPARAPDEAAAPHAAPAAPAAAAPPARGEKLKISPVARRIAQENGIEVALLKGTGPEGRITKEDVEKAIADRDRKPGPAKPAAPPAAAAPAQPGSSVEAFEDVETTKMRRVIAQRLSESKRTAPHFYIDFMVDATALSAIKRDLDRSSEQRGLIKPTFNDIVIKLVAQALREFPMVNGTYLDDRIRMHRDINVGVAVGIEDGLIVPVIRNVDRKSILQIGQEVRDLAAKARNKKLLPDEYSHGTFTITNLGMFGVDTFHAIINPPESAILAVSAIKRRPVVDGDAIVIKATMNLSLSVDHRIVDGVMAAQFLGRVKELIESPYLLFV